VENFYHGIRLASTLLNHRGCFADIRAGRPQTNAACVCLPACMYLIIPQTDPVHRLRTIKAHSFLLEINRGAVLLVTKLQTIFGQDCSCLQSPCCKRDPC